MCGCFCRNIIIGCLSMTDKCIGILKLDGVKQLKNLFAYERKSSKVLNWVSSDNWAKLQRYWEDPEFQKLSSQNKKNRIGDREGVGPSFRTCGAIPIIEQRRRLVMMSIFKQILLFNDLLTVTQPTCNLCNRSHFKGNQQSISCTRTPTCVGRMTIRAIGCAKNWS